MRGLVFALFALLSRLHAAHAFFLSTRQSQRICRKACRSRILSRSSVKESVGKQVTVGTCLGPFNKEMSLCPVGCILSALSSCISTHQS
jgi:hypothetical protein